MIIAIIIGYSLGTLAAFFVSRWLLGALAARYGSRREQQHFIRVSGGVLGAIALAPAIFLAIVSGGYLEKYYAGVSTASTALGQFGRLLVPILGLGLITAITVTAASAAGAVMGVLAARSLFPDRTAQRQ